ncbi:MAG: hypothetical protein M1833_003888 [Piccolia ochrophora]|nr:MAG: hypothetical protein M1833_003888 [Piccolia ochrophora]
MALWFFSEHAVVIYLVLRYLLHGNEFRTPSFGLFCVSDQIYIQIRLYFLAKYLQLPDLEDIAFDMLLLSEGSFAPPDVIDLARLSYGEACKKDTRIRTFLARRVERNLRALLCIPAWGKLLRSASSSLAADMFELVSVVQLQGEAGGYPIRLPLVAPTVPTVTGPWQELCAVAVRNFYPSACGEILLLRGEKLHDCRIIGNSVFGVNNNGVRGRVERDFVELILEVEQEEESDTTELNDDDDDDSSEEAVPYDVDEILGADDDVDDTDEELYNLELSKVKKHQSPQTRDKASWILGLDYVMDVFADSPTPRSSTSTSVLMDKKTNGSRRFRLKT